MLNFYDSDDYVGNRHIEVSDDGCEGWRVSLNIINGEVHTGFCAEEAHAGDSAQRGNTQSRRTRLGFNDTTSLDG